ncbi:tellurium resistance protein [Streptomyces sp. NPDC052079]|uniref:tellurium resistance protein n=1 Tax=Streptomyces sp. NPDC052079 TaxID=3155526 RepID=UPI00342E0C33
MTGSPVELSNWSPQARIAGHGRLQVNLNWSAAAKADLDLGCMVRTRDGRGDAIQPLGANFGSFDHWPYLELDQDDRTGQASDGETLRVNLERWREFQQLVVYVYVYEGSVDFRTLGGVVTMTAPSGTWRIHLDDSPAGATACAIARLVPGREGLELTREVRWFSPKLWDGNQQQIDRAYGFGLNWVWGTK